MGKNWAIVIGINEYRNLKRLNYARRDAELVRDFFRQDMEFTQVDYFAENAPPIETKPSSPPLSALPNFEDLDNYLERRFRKPFLGAGDTLWFFFAGHGKRFNKRDYLLPSGVNPRQPDRAGLAVTHIVEKLQNSGAGNIILLIDACRDEDSRDGEGIGLENHQGIIRLFSCAPSQISYEIEELQQGAFTYALLQGLRMQGEGNCATVGRLAEYVRVQVPYLVEKYKGEKQNPILGLEPESKKDLIILPRQATPHDVIQLKFAASTAENEGELDLAEELWIRVLAASPADMQAVRALQRIERSRWLSQGNLPSRYSPDAGEGRNAVVIPPPVEPPKLELLNYSFSIITLDSKGQKINEKRGSAKYFVEDLGNGVKLEMVQIPGGEFWMGDDKRGDSEKPRHRVKVPAFSMGKFMVTLGQWQQVAKMPKIKIDLNPEPSRFKDSKELPVDSINWYESIEFCARLSKHTGKSYRLSSEAEWEYACRAGTETPFHFGATITPEYVNYDGNYPYAQAAEGQYRKKTTTVGSFPPNGFGLYDMHGELWSWCSDRWHENYNGAPTDGSSWETGTVENRRVIRGGSWLSDAVNCRSAIRGRNDADDWDNYVGFRLVVS